MIQLLGVTAGNFLMSKWADRRLAQREVAATHSPADLEELFQELNRKHFGGRLKKRRVIFEDHLPDDIAGEVDLDSKNSPIKLSPRWVKSKRDLRETLLHEMAHLKLNEANHTQAFCQEIKRLGLNDDFTQLCKLPHPAEREKGGGRRFKFHGAFATEEAAKEKHKETPGSWVLPRTIKGHQRWLVLTRR